VFWRFAALVGNSAGRRGHSDSQASAAPRFFLHAQSRLFLSRHRARYIEANTTLSAVSSVILCEDPRLPRIRSTPVFVSFCVGVARYISGN